MIHVFICFIVQALIPPDSKSNYDLHLEYSVRDLKSYKQNMAVDIAFIYPSDCIPTESELQTKVDPKKIKEDLISICSEKIFIILFYFALNECFRIWFYNLVTGINR